MHSRQLADIISSRICHDLISPVGAISNGVELMTEINGMTPEMELINQSAETAKAKLMFFRIAFGSASKTAVSGHSATISVVQKMFVNGRVEVAFTEPWGDRPRSLVKLLYLLILCVESSLPRGGVISITPTRSGWEFLVENTKIDAPHELWDATLNGDPFGDLSSNQVQFQLARDAAEAIDIKLAGSFTEDRLSLIF